MLPREYEILYNLENSYWWFTGMKLIMDRILGPTIKPSSKLLDVGCGTGGRLQMLSRRCQTWGIDCHPRAAGYCRQRGLANITQGDAASLPYSDGMFTHVTCCDVLQNLEDDRAGIREAFRVLKPGGLYYISEQAFPLLRSQHDISQEAIRRYTQRRLQQLLTDPGFEILRMTGANSILFPALAAYRLASRMTHPVESVKREQARSHIFPLPGALNSALFQVLKLEGKWIASGRNLPWGLSVIVLAKKPGPEPLSTDYS